MSSLYRLPLLLVIYFALYYGIEKFLPASDKGKMILQLVLFIIYVGSIVFFLIRSAGDSRIDENNKDKRK